MATDLTIYLEDDPGELARLGEALGSRNVNIDGLCAMSGSGGAAEVHVLVDDAATAFEALEAARIKVESEQEVLVVDVDDRPGEIGRHARRLGEAGVNLRVIYLATATRLVIGANDLDKAARICST